MTDQEHTDQPVLPSLEVKIDGTDPDGDDATAFAVVERATSRGHALAVILQEMRPGWQIDRVSVREQMPCVACDGKGHHDGDIVELSRADAEREILDALLPRDESHDDVVGAQAETDAAEAGGGVR